SHRRLTLHPFLFFSREVDGFAREAPRDFGPLIFSGKEVAWFKASLTHLSTAPCSALPCPLTANIPSIGRDGMKSQARTCGLLSCSAVVRPVEPDYQVVPIPPTTHVPGDHKRQAPKHHLLNLVCAILESAPNAFGKKLIIRHRGPSRLCRLSPYEGI